MKIHLAIILSFLFILNAYGQNSLDSLGFTDKSEAKNKTVNGLREGKWFEYLYDGDEPSSDPKAPYYMLTIYRLGKPSGIRRIYQNKKSKVLLWEEYFNNGKKNGNDMEYFPNGQIKNKTTWVNDSIEGVEKEYYWNGKLYRETMYDHDKVLSVKYFHKNGDLSDQVLDSEGNELKQRK